MFGNKVFLFLFILVFFVSFANASALTQVQINSILNMLSAFGADLATINKVRAALEGESSSVDAGPNAQSNIQSQASLYNNSNVSNTNFSSSNLFCPSLSKNLKRGSRGKEVEYLQEFLRRTGFYKYPEITGYFGSLTEEAVKAFQRSQAIVSYGSPDSTGYGVVGPKTRAYIKNFCTDGKLVKDFVVTPKMGSVPMEAVATFSYRGSNCTSFSLDWGDGANPIVGTQSTEICDSYLVKKIARHTYNSKGTYTVSLRVSRGGKEDLYTQKVYVSSSSKSSAGNFDIYPTEGQAPLVVGVSFVAGADECSSYKVDWGDGSADERVGTGQTCNPLFKRYALNHTYKNPGEYELKIYVGIGNDLKLVESRYIEVAKSGTKSSKAKASNLALSTRVEPTSGDAPLQVKVKLQHDSSSCVSYSIDWGDGTSKIEKNSQNGCAKAGVNKEFVHTYFTPGTYFMKIKVGEKALQDLPVDVYGIKVY